jgi:esterase/lipase superfamily enzyme
MRVALLIVLQAVDAGCSGRIPLAPAPNLYWATGEHPFDDVPEAWRTTDIEILYATDRVGEADDRAGVAYDHRRSHSVAFGKATVEVGDDLSWEELVEASITRKRRREIPMKLARAEEVVRLPPSNTAMELTADDEFVVPADYLKAVKDAEGRIHDAIRAQLAHTERKEVFVYVHGYNNTFEDASIRMATLWHYLGRQGVPILYSWPAAFPDALRGYTYDRESSEFTIFHLKQIGEMLSRCPEVERIHIVAHSRGTDVTLNMLREFWIAERAEWMERQARGEEQPGKLGTVIIAAADIDIDVFQQRISAERLAMPLDTIVFYLSQGDRAIGLARWLFASVNRIGKITMQDISAEGRKSLMRTDRVQVIDSKVDSGFLGHSYFITNPAVLSDLILVLRDNRGPGPEKGRPLQRKDDGFWTITDTYLVAP